MVNVVSDIAGQYKALLALISKMPDEEVISIGDMVDRGPQSKEVLDWFMKNGKAVLGNHEHLMLDFYGHLGLDKPYYSKFVWQYNGGTATEESFDNKRPSDEILDWLVSLPLYLKIDDHLISHAFIPKDCTLKKACDLNRSNSIIWNRANPTRRPEYKIQLSGHNSQMGLKHFDDKKGRFATCLDDSRKRVLTGIHLPSMKIYQQDYID